MTTNEITFNPFTKEDWYGFGGASRLPDGSEPLIAYGPVAQPNGRTDDGGAYLICGNELVEGGLSFSVNAYDEADEQMFAWFKDFDPSFTVELVKAWIAANRDDLTKHMERCA